MDLERIKQYLNKINSDIPKSINTQTGYFPSFETELFLVLADDYVTRKEQEAIQDKPVEEFIRNNNPQPIQLYHSGDQLEQKESSKPLSNDKGHIIGEGYVTIPPQKTVKIVPFGLMASANNYCSGRDLDERYASEIREFVQWLQESFKKENKFLSLIKKDAI